MRPGRIVQPHRSMVPAPQRKQATDQRQGVLDAQAAAKRLALEQRDQAAKQQHKAEQDRAGRPAEKGVERPLAQKQDNARLARHDEIRRERDKLSADRRRVLHTAFNVNRARLAHARFARRVGTHIPRSVRLLAVPAAVIAVFPYYRDYDYVVVEDSICIVDPATYEIVDVLDEDYFAPSGGRPQVAQLTLTPAEQALVLNSVPRDFPEADVRLRLALGADIPNGVQLHEFARVVLDSVPRLRDFRFIAAQGAIVIVDPRDRSVAFVLER